MTMIGSTRQIRIIGRVQNGEVVLTHEAERWFDDLYQRTGGIASGIPDVGGASIVSVASANVADPEISPGIASPSPDAGPTPGIAPVASYTQEIISVNAATYTIPRLTHDHTIVHVIYSGDATITLPLFGAAHQRVTINNETGNTVTVEGS